MAVLSTGPVIGTSVAPVAQNVGIALPEQPGVAPLPAGLPVKVVSELAWTGSEFEDNLEYVYALTDKEIAEIVKAVAHFKTLGLDGSMVSLDNFSLPTLGAKLHKASQDVHNGRGFCVLRGIKPENFSVEDLTLIFLGVQSYIADQRGRQDSKGNMLVHIVADNSSERRLQHHRHSTRAITFHTEESGDIVGWLTRSTAASGGKCVLASGHTVYNTLAARRPDIVRLLARYDWPFALPHFLCRPVIFFQDGKLIMNFGRTALMGNAAHPRPQRLPSVSPRQLEALDAIESIAQATQVEIQTQAGDMHFINNLAVLHRREAFTDGEDSDEKRHLVRVRLRSSTLGWNIPEELKREWHEAFEKQGRRAWHVEPMPDAFFPLRFHPN